MSFLRADLSQMRQAVDRRRRISIEGHGGRFFASPPKLHGSGWPPRASTCKGTLYKWKLLAYNYRMIRSFRNKELANLWAGSRSKIDSRMHDRLLARLDVLNAAAKPDDMDVSGWDFHMLRGKPQRFTVHVNGPWCLTFEFDQGDAWRVDFEQYH